MKKCGLFLVMTVVIMMVGCSKKEIHNLQTEQIPVKISVEKIPTEKKPAEDITPQNEMESYLASVKEQSEAIKDYLENEAMTQDDMNLKAQELYELWDGALNYLWNVGKGRWSEEEFEKMLDEQRTWIAEKEIAVEEAGKEFAGGSIYPLMVNSEAAKWTEERVFLLYELLK